MQDNLSEKLATAAKKILDSTAASRLMNEEMVAQGYPRLGIKADFGDVQLYVKVRELETLTAPDGSVFSALGLEVLVSVAGIAMKHHDARLLAETLLDVSACAAKLEETLEGPTWVLNMTAEEAMARRMQSHRRANETLACAIVQSAEGKESLKRIRVGETRVVEHPSARLLERCELTWNVVLAGGRAYSVRGMDDADSVWVTRDA